ncbi:unnamed protein product [Mytilus coruscus]|uniref:Uncharacterized protein n=1 Tax=Mytilus coruscus TaxID=42192 RepID=A0A6J8CQ88_MYTCO|nr:unnamed protein product [Mytilus coruscus]
MSELLRQTSKEAKKGNSDNKKQVAVIGNKFLKHQEISAQEAVYICLQMRLKNSSCGHIFINTSPPDERPFKVKPIEELEKLPENSTDIRCGNIFKRYSSRPKYVENMCLADFGAWYDMKIESKKEKVEDDKKELIETDDEDNADDCAYSSDEHENEDHPQTLKYRMVFT